ncbi:hypothetical protein VIGAN_01420000, partial [Vigna angularis var. angularis]
YRINLQIYVNRETCGGFFKSSRNIFLFQYATIRCALFTRLLPMIKYPLFNHHLTSCITLSPYMPLLPDFVVIWLGILCFSLS